MECNISGCPYFNAFKKFYTYDCVDKNTIEFSCLNNFHYVSGNVTSSCINNTWTSEEAIVCEVDYLMQSSILAPLIAGSTIFLCFIFLFIDLYLYRLDSIRIHNSVVRRHWHCGPLRVLENYTMRPLQYQGKVKRKRLRKYMDDFGLGVISTTDFQPPTDLDEDEASGAVDKPERLSVLSERQSRLQELNDRESMTKEQIKMYKKRLEELEHEVKEIVKARDGFLFKLNR